MRHVNFQNPQSFHAYTFLASQPAVIDAMLAAAFDAAADDDSLDLDGPTRIISAKLSGAIEEYLTGLALEAGYGTGESYIGDVCDGTTASLFLPIVWAALEEIDCWAIAQAILVDAGHWCPEKVTEVEPQGDGAERDDGSGGAKVPVG
jgi:hypothetical protein